VIDDSLSDRDSVEAIMRGKFTDQGGLPKSRLPGAGFAVPAQRGKKQKNRRVTRDDAGKPGFPPKDRAERMARNHEVLAAAIARRRQK
jgi:hypothetical protein